MLIAKIAVLGTLLVLFMVAGYLTGFRAGQDAEKRRFRRG